MGKKIIIKGADFSANAIETAQDGYVCANNTMASVVSGTAGWWGFGQYQTNRLTIVGVNAKPIRLPKQSTITLTGLKGNGSKTALWLDWIKLDSPVLMAMPQATSAYVSGNAPNLIGTASNFVSSNYFPLNHSNGTSITVTNDRDYDVWIVFVAKAGSAGSALSSSDYTTHLRFTIAPIS